MTPFNEGVTLDPDGQKAHPFLRRRIADALMMHFADTVMLFLAIFAGDALLLFFHGVPIQMERMLLLIPVWWIGTWIVRLVPGWGLGVVEELRRIELLLVTIFAEGRLRFFLGLASEAEAESHFCPRI